MIIFVTLFMSLYTKLVVRPAVSVSDVMFDIRSYVLLICRPWASTILIKRPALSYSYVVALPLPSTTRTHLPRQIVRSLFSRSVGIARRTSRFGHRTRTMHSFPIASVFPTRHAHHAESARSPCLSHLSTNYQIIVFISGRCCAIRFSKHQTVRLAYVNVVVVSSASVLVSDSFVILVCHAPSASLCIATWPYSLYDNSSSIADHTAACRLHV